MSATASFTVSTLTGVALLRQVFQNKIPAAPGDDGHLHVYLTTAPASLIAVRVETAKDTVQCKQLPTAAEIKAFWNKFCLRFGKRFVRFEPCISPDGLSLAFCLKWGQPAVQAYMQSGGAIIIRVG